MKNQIKNLPILKKLLWLDFILGCATAIIGLLFYNFLAKNLGFTSKMVLIIAIINLLYSIFAFSLAIKKRIDIPLLKILINANWIWTIISVCLIFFHFENATVFGQVFLILQIPVVGGLAWLEGNQIIRNSNN